MHLKNDAASQEQTYSFTVRFYRPHLICVEVNMKDCLNGDVNHAFPVRNLDAHPCAKVVVDCLIGILLSGVIRDYSRSNSFYSKAALLIPTEVQGKDFLGWKEEHKHVIAALLINNVNYEQADTALADKIFAKNKEVDAKFSKAAFSLISKQGILTCFAGVSDSFERHVRSEHVKRFRFLEYALALQELVAEYPMLRKQDEDVADFLLYLALPYLNSETILQKSVTGTYAWQILAEELGLAKLLAGLDKSVIEEVNLKAPFFLTIGQSEFDCLDYRARLNLATRSYRKSWIIKDFEGRKIIPWTFGTILIPLFIFVWKYFFG